MTNFEARMFEKFSEATEDAIAEYLNDKNITLEALKEYFGNYTIYEKIINYLEVIK